MNPLEDQLRAAGSQPQRLAAQTGTADQGAPERVAENLLTIHAALDAPAESRLARVLRKLGVPDLSIPLVTATPALRRSWFVAVGVAIVFALSASANQNSDGVEQIIVFLTLAPLMPLLGVALAFGTGVDPTHELVLAAPRDTFTVFMVRSLTVLTASAGLLLIASLLLPAGGIYRVAWLLPALAVTAATMALATDRDPRRTALVVAVAWMIVVLVVRQATSSATMFGPVTQFAAVAVVAVAAGVLFGRRERFDMAEVR